MAGYSATMTEGVTRAYVIERAVPKDAETVLDFNWVAYRQDVEGWSDKQSRFLCYGKTIGEVAMYLSLHYPGSVLAGIWPQGEADDDPRTRQVLDHFGLTGNG